MNVFANYARYYDLLYQDKDYKGEAGFINQLVKSYAPETQSILELGCGTGNHAVLLANEGYRIHGVDLSEEMLRGANIRRLQTSQDIASRLEFSQGDLRDVRINRTFDTVISLFHVISYQVTNSDLLNTFFTVREHLKPDGLFVFDVWYGPAVLSDRPLVRVKRLQDDKISVTRIAEPVMYPNQNLVEVNYQILVQDLATKEIEEIKETHRMRYLFQPEIEVLLQQSQMELVASGEWMTGSEPSSQTWNAYFVARAV